MNGELGKSFVLIRKLLKKNVWDQLISTLILTLPISVTNVDTINSKTDSYIFISSSGS